jgi:2-methylcitrate dehydratase PrpD
MMAVDRRTFLGASSVIVSGALAPTRASAQASGPTQGPIPDPAADAKVTPAFIKLLERTRYDSLPPSVQHEAKRYLLDAVGCGLAGFQTDKARLSVAFARNQGGRSDSRILGVAGKVPATSAAFANGELINALDYDALPHIPPLIVPPLLAVAEMSKSSGKDLMTATVLAHELGARLSADVGAMGTVLAARRQDHPAPQYFGIGNECIIGAAAAASKLLGLDADHTAWAMGLAGYYCAVPAAHDWETGSPKTMIKYTPMGWSCQGAVTAALMAREGYTGNPIVLDGIAGFPVFYSKKFWDPDHVVAGLDLDWRILKSSYKAHACCRFTHAQADCMTRLMNTNAFKPEEIESIDALGSDFEANPDMLNVRTQEDAQFSLPYVLAVIACGHRVTPQAQSAERMNDPKVRAMMTKISWGILGKGDTEHARVTVMAKGQRYVEEVSNFKGAAVAGYALTDEELTAKFLENATPKLGDSGARAAADLLWNLDAVRDINRLMDRLCTA